MSYAVELIQLTKDFGKLRVVDHLQLGVHRSELFALVGPDGAGKTTTMRLICGALLADDGDARVEEVSVQKDPERVKRLIGYMSQRFSLYSELTVAENIRFFADLRGVKPEQRRQRSKQLLEMTRLTEFVSRRTEQLSGGMKQKLALACTLVHVPKVLLLDEPTTGVDPVSRREFWRILHNLKKSGVTVLVSTPYMDEAERCDRVGFLHLGKLLRVGTPQSLIESLPGGIVRVISKDLFRVKQLLRDIPGVSSLQMFGDRLHLLCLNPVEVLKIVETKLKVLAEQPVVQVAKPSLEDAFVNLAQS